MIPSLFTWGHLLMRAGLLALYGAWQLTLYLSPGAHRRGTPGHARARGGRRSALVGAGLGAALFALGCPTPLSEAAIA
ncbi:MAG TPA: hypothetical protein VEZ20_16000 [Allosphingosinicella sp.]|nr:hypothetical protein [Allosphingosinicella sp.]